MNKTDVMAAVVVAERIREEANEDYVGLWKLPWHLRRELPDASDGLVFELGHAILGGLLRVGLVLGDLDGTSGTFIPWPQEEALNAAMTAWRSLGRDPNIGEVAWLALAC
jgi:hypothetical protein